MVQFLFWYRGRFVAGRRFGPKIQLGPKAGRAADSRGSTRIVDRRIAKLEGTLLNAGCKYSPHPVKRGLSAAADTAHT